MREAVIVSTARTPIGKAFRGAFNNTHGATMAGHAIEHAVARSGLDPAEIEDVILGCGFPEGATGHNIGRIAAIRAGLPITTAGTVVNRFCSSGLQSISMAAQRILVDGVPAMVAGGVESISLTQANVNMTHRMEPKLAETKPEIWMSMIETADTVAGRYGVSREAQDEYSLQSQMRTAAAQQAGRFDDEIVPMTSVMQVKDKDTGAVGERTVTLEQDEGNRPTTTLEGLAALQPVRAPDQWITAGIIEIRLGIGDGPGYCAGARSTTIELHRKATERHMPIGR